MDLRDLMVDFDSETDLQQTISYLTFVLDAIKKNKVPKLPNPPPKWTLQTSKYGFNLGTNPAGPEAEYRCSYCDLELFGDEIGYIAAGTNYANGEFARCPQCGNENQVYRDDEDDE